MIDAERSPVLVRGVGDVGSAVAAVLFRAGYAVVLHDEPAPATPRRGMAFADAVFDGTAALDGLTLCASIPPPSCSMH
jgi:xanthine dehydrogenase accessory factor